MNRYIENRANIYFKEPTSVYLFLHPIFKNIGNKELIDYLEKNKARFHDHFIANMKNLTTIPNSEKFTKLYQSKNKYDHLFEMIDWCAEFYASISKSGGSKSVNDPCSICLEPLSRGNVYVVNCGNNHLYHRECIIRACPNNICNCPYCRRPITNMRPLSDGVYTELPRRLPTQSYVIVSDSTRQLAQQRNYTPQPNYTAIRQSNISIYEEAPYIMRALEGLMAFITIFLFNSYQNETGTNMDTANLTVCLIMFIYWLVSLLSPSSRDRRIRHAMVIRYTEGNRYLEYATPDEIQEFIARERNW
jgi:hypothetical protein